MPLRDSLEYINDEETEDLTTAYIALLPQEVTDSDISGISGPIFNIEIDIGI